MKARTKFQRYTTQLMQEDESVFQQLTPAHVEWAKAQAVRLDHQELDLFRYYAKRGHGRYVFHCQQCGRYFNAPGQGKISRRQLGTVTRECPVCKNVMHRESLVPKKCFRRYFPFFVISTYKGLQTVVKYGATVSLKRGETELQAEVTFKDIYWIDDKGHMAFFNQWLNKRGSKRNGEFIGANGLSYSLMSRPYGFRMPYFPEIDLIKPLMPLRPTIEWLLEQYPWMRDRFYPDLLQCLLGRYHLLWEAAIKRRHTEIIPKLSCPKRFLKKYGASYKIACRHHYEPTDWDLWFDMIDLLRQAEKDVSNPKFVCPKDLNQGHDFALDVVEQYKKEQRRKWYREGPFDLDWFFEFIATNQLKERLQHEHALWLEILRDYPLGGWHTHNWEQWRAEGYMLVITLAEISNQDTGDLEFYPQYTWEDSNGEEDENGIFVHTDDHPYYFYQDDVQAPIPGSSDVEKFESLKTRFKDLRLEDGELILMALNSVKEYVDEARVMHNCIAALKYYLKPSSLIMSARVDGNSVADVEIDLRTFHVLQCYGPSNRPTPYRERICNLIAANVDTIKERLREKSG